MEGDGSPSTLDAAAHLERQGEPLTALDVLSRGEFGGADEVRRLHLLATLLCELGDPDRALAILADLDDSDETIGRRGSDSGSVGPWDRRPPLDG